MKQQTAVVRPGSESLAVAIRNEKDRIARRRKQLAVPDFGAGVKGHVALALSGGGIRSATFALGVMQALARLRQPATCNEGAASAEPAPDEPAQPLLSSFDYLSTVSGGGYIGAFFCSLFVPRRLRKNSSAKEAAADAIRVLAYEPPTRIRSATSYNGAALISAPTAWLRESGRYLMPTGAGDMLYAAAMAVRNWLAVQYVLASLLLLAFALMALARSALAQSCPWIGGIELLWLGSSPNTGHAAIWWSTLWLLPGALAALWLLPVGIAYWISYPDPRQSERDAPRRLPRAALGAACAGLMMLLPAFGMLKFDPPIWREVAWSAIAAGVLTLAALLLYWIELRWSESIVQYRVRMTRRLASGLSLAIVLVLLAAADTIGQTLYFNVKDGIAGPVLTPAGLIAAAVWLIRHLAVLFEDKGKPAWIAKISLNLVAGVAGALVFLLIATLWALLVQWIRWHGDWPEPSGFFDPTHLTVLGWSSVIFAGLAVVAGRFPAFINLSTLQSFYGSRLTRAYLGASNGKRFEAGSEGKAGRSVAEPLSGDQLAHADYYGELVLAPLHLINVTINQTVDPAEQLVQRDRKGEPLCVLPGGFSIDGRHYALRDEYDGSLIQEQMTIGQWIGTSGAAFTTGLGRSTSFGFSMLLGLANVRLGTWWLSGYGRDRAPWAERAFKSVFRTQTFLLYELMGRFYGLHRERQYLSDGGHFENTAIYELLRPEREVGLIVACDNGCDPGYQFGDLANLIRLARIDFRIEIKVDSDITRDPVLGRVFGVPADFDPNAAPNDRCATLFNVHRAEPSGPSDQPACRIIVLKPRRVRSIPLDVQEYADRHPTFPQETTADQFFDEAQWESYRCLGFSVANLVFGSKNERSDGVGEQLWAYLAQKNRGS